MSVHVRSSGVSVGVIQVPRFVTVVKPNWTRAEIDTESANVGSSGWPWESQVEANSEKKRMNFDPCPTKRLDSHIQNIKSTLFEMTIPENYDIWVVCI